MGVEGDGAVAPTASAMLWPVAAVQPFSTNDSIVAFANAACVISLALDIQRSSFPSFIANATFIGFSFSLPLIAAA